MSEYCHPKKKTKTPPQTKASRDRAATSCLHIHTCGPLKISHPSQQLANVSPVAGGSQNVVKRLITAAFIPGLEGLAALM